MNTDGDVSNTVAEVGPSPRGNVKFTPEEDDGILEYLIDHPVGNLRGNPLFWADYHENYSTRRSFKSLTTRANKTIFPSLPNYHLENDMKALLYCKYQIQPPHDFLPILQMSLNITLDGHGLITAFSPKQVIQNPVFESSGPLLPPIPPVPRASSIRIKQEVQEPQDEDMEVCTSHNQNPVDLGNVKRQEEEEEEEYEDEEEVEDEEEHMEDEKEIGGEEEELTEMQEMQEIQNMQHIPMIEQPMMQAYDQNMEMGHVLLPHEVPFPPFSAIDHLEQMRRSIVEDVNANMRETLFEVLEQQKEPQPEMPMETTSLKAFLGDLKIAVANHQTAVMDDIEDRIDEALEVLKVKDVMTPMDKIHVFLDIALKVMGH